jgi:gamma-glutamyltranspeptidase/glutathione hydrolase
VLHSINTVLWGSTGIFVDGVSIPDSGAINQRVILAAGPGTRLYEGMNPLIVLKQGKPYLASSAVGSGLFNVTLQNLINVLDFGMDVRGAVAQPNTFGGMRKNDQIEAVDSGFSPEVLDAVRARGQQIEAVKDYEQAGYWVGVQFHSLLVHKLAGATAGKIPGFVEGY